jgi:hypothetical protein
MLQLRGQPHGKLPGLCKVERSKGRAYKADASTSRPHERCNRSLGFSARDPRRAFWGTEELRPWVVSCGAWGRVVNPTTPPLPQPTPKPAEAPKQGKATTSRKKVKATQPAVAAPQQAPMKKQTMNGKSSPPPKKPNPASIPPPNQSPIEIFDLLDNLPVNACVELTRRLLTAVPTLPSGAARSRAVLIIVIHFVAEYGSTP